MSETLSQSVTPAKGEILAKYFEFARNKTTYRQEILAGVTTFLTMAYIIFVNPSVLGMTGMDRGSVFVATCIVAAMGSFFIGIFSRYPVAVAPAMALNVYFTYVVVKGLGMAWQDALGAVFIASLVFFIMSCTRLRTLVVASIPKSLNVAITVGLGLFIALIAMKNSGIVVVNATSFMALGHMGFQALFFVLGFMLIVVLDYYRIPGAIIIGIIAVTIVALFSGLAKFAGVFSMPPSLAPTLSQMRFSQLDNLKGISVIFSILFVAFFDCAGTLVGLVQHAKLNRSGHTIKRISRGLIADSMACVLGSVLGTSPPSPYLESAAGIRAGGRTGLTAMVVALLFLFALFLSPLASTIPNFATAPALLFVSCLMLRSVTDIPWDDVTESIPAAVTALTIPFTLSIANGIGAGVISYTIIKMLCRKIAELNATLIVLALLFVFYFLMQATVV